MVYIAMRLKWVCLSFQVLYVCRNVKDAVVSYFHHESLMKSHDLRCDFITYARYFPLWKKVEWRLYLICLVNHFVLRFLWHFTSSGRFINQACACTVGFLRCWSLDGSEEITQTWCSIGKKVLHRSEEQCVTLKVWGAKAGSRGHVEEDRRLHRLWLDRRGYSGSCSLQWTSVRLDFFTWQWQS